MGRSSKAATATAVHSGILPILFSQLAEGKQNGRKLPASHPPNALLLR
jgi:hypothetical protein